MWTFFKGWLMEARAELKGLAPDRRPGRIVSQLHEYEQLDLDPASAHTVDEVRGFLQAYCDALDSGPIDVAATWKGSGKKRPPFEKWMQNARKTLRETPRSGEPEVLDALLNDFAAHPPQMEIGEAETEAEVCGRLREYCDLLAHGGGANPSKAHRRTADSSMAEYRECATCAAKPGSPTLCPTCLHNRNLVMDLNEKLTVAELNLENVSRRWEDLRAQLANADSVRASNKYLEEAIRQIPDLGADEDYRVAVRRVVQEGEQLATALATARRTNADWLRENGPGGWIDELRHEVTRLRERDAHLRAAMLEAEGSLRCADVQSLASDDQIIMGRVREAATVLRVAREATKERG